LNGAADDGGGAAAGPGKFMRFLREPLAGVFPKPMSIAGDYLSLAGALCFLVSISGLVWINAGIDLDAVIDRADRTPALGWIFKLAPYGSKERILELIPESRRDWSVKIFQVPWTWLLIIAFVGLLLGLWFVQARGGVTIGIGVFSLVFAALFYVMAIKKVAEVIGAQVSFLRMIPLIGDWLAGEAESFIKSVIFVNFSTGFYLYIVAGVLLVVGGSMRLAKGKTAACGEALAGEGVWHKGAEV